MRLSLPTTRSRCGISGKLERKVAFRDSGSSGFVCDIALRIARNVANYTRTSLEELYVDGTQQPDQAATRS